MQSWYWTPNFVRPDVASAWPLAYRLGFGPERLYEGAQLLGPVDGVLPEAQRQRSRPKLLPRRRNLICQLLECITRCNNDASQYTEMWTWS